MIASIAALCLMTAELLASELLFGHFLERRSFFWARYLGSSAICLALVLWTAIIYSLVTGSDFDYNGSAGWQETLFKFFCYIAIFALTIYAVRFSFTGTTWEVLFYCSGAYALQHIVSNMFSLIRIIPAAGVWFDGHAALYALIEACMCLPVYIAVYFIFIHHRAAAEEGRMIRGKVLLFLSVVFICIGISRLTTDNIGRDWISHLAESVSAIVSCIFILVEVFGMTDRDKAESEVRILKELMRREREQYRMTKENIDIINIKCHDLKHQIRALGSNASAAYVKKVEDAVMFYDSVVKTGNDVLDVILTEYSLQCESNRITFTCMARGKDLAFIDDMDIYSLFGNALSNAFEGARSVADEDRRCIFVNVHTENGVLSVHVENFFNGQISEKDGFPITSKGDNNYHGFGIKSMDYIARKYGGHMTISAENGIFSLDLVFPLPHQLDDEGIKIEN